jgi:hypothetical protein
VWNLASDVAGPLLFGFVHWCLEEAERSGIQRLYFVSRDGQVLQQLALILIEKWNYKVESRYLYGSRQAWHPASIGSLNQTDLEWILVPNKFFSLRQLLARVGLSPDNFKSEATESGLPADQPDRNLSEDERTRTETLLRKAAVKEAIERESAHRRKLVSRYLEQEGLFDETPSALVDVGWHGNMQRSLSKLLELAGKKAVLTGFYFGLLKERKHNPNDRLKAYWNHFQPPERGVRGKDRIMMEVFAAADHGSVFGYAENDSTIGPVLNRPRNTQALGWGTESLQAGVRAFALEFCGLTRREECRPEVLFEIARGNFHRLVYDPAREEAEVLGRFQFSDDQTESSFSPLIPDWSTSTALRAVVQRRLRPPFWWHEGFLAIHPSLLLRAYVALLNFKEKRLDAKKQLKHE